MFNRKIVLVFACVSLVFSIMLIQKTYAKYLTTAEGNANISIARWKLNVNNQDIISNSSITNAINPIFSGNAHVSEDVIAPRSEGYFDIIIDSTNVDVSFKYTISTTVAPNSSVTDLKITGYSINGSTTIPVTGNITDVSNTILLGSGVTTTSIRIYITWDDSDTSSMNNAEDTMASLKNGTANLNVLLSFTQVTQ